MAKRKKVQTRAGVTVDSTPPSTRLREALRECVGRLEGARLRCCWSCKEIPCAECAKDAAALDAARKVVSHE